MISKLRVLLLLVAALLAAVFVSVSGRAQAAPFVVDRQAVTPQFPDHISFSLTTHLAGKGTITRADLSYQVHGDPYTRGVAGEFTPAARATITAEVDTQITYIPPGVVVDYYWTLESSAGQRFDTPRAQFRYDDERFPWQMRAVRGVQLHWQGDNPAYAEALIAATDGGITHLQAQTGLTLPLPVEVWVYPTEDDLRDALPPGEPEWVGGEALPRLGVVLALVPDDAQAAGAAKGVLPHELAHIAIDAATRNPYNTPPLWLNEGLAVSNQQDNDPFLDETLEKAARARALLPLHTLESSFPADPDQALLAYGESASAVRFLLDHYGSERVQRLLIAFQQGITYDDALRQALGLTTEQLDTAWRATLPQPQAPVPTGTPEPVAPPSPTQILTATLVARPSPTVGTVPVAQETRPDQPFGKWALIEAGLCVVLLLVAAGAGLWRLWRWRSRRA